VDPAPSAARLSRLAARDSSARVRGAALRRLASLPAEQSLAPLLAAFEDPDPEVREAAIAGAAALGEPAVPALAERALGSPMERARAPVAALALAGPVGAAALARVAQDHPDEQVRALCRVLLGRPAFPGH
jgi:HEAT repeat protein